MTPLSKRNPRVYIAQNKELGGPMNPTGIIDANFLILVRMLGEGDDPQNVQQALYDWLGGLRQGRKVTPEGLDKMLELGPDKALSAIIQHIGGGLDERTLPPKAIETLRKALAQIASQYVHRQGQQVGREIARLRGVRQQYRAESLVRWLSA